jgi:hypothetical protein
MHPRHADGVGQHHPASPPSTGLASAPNLDLVQLLNLGKFLHIFLFPLRGSADDQGGRQQAT